VSREIFIDASAWIMISDNRSKYFIEASEFYRHILQNNRLLVTTLPLHLKCRQKKFCVFMLIKILVLQMR